MISESDIWRSAKLLVDQHGADAPVVAAMRSAEMFRHGDVEGQQAWRRIAKAAAELLYTKSGGPVH